MSARSRLMLAAAALSTACASTPGSKATPAAEPVAVAPRSPRVFEPRTAVLVPTIERFAAARDGSPVLLAERDGKVVAYVADEDDAIIRVIDVDDGHEIASVLPGGAPAQLVMTSEGKVIATLRDVSELVVLSTALTVEKRVAASAEPIGLALSPDGATLVVTSGFSHTVSILDAHTMITKELRGVAREPRGVVVSKDGLRAFVAHAVGATIDVLPLATSAAAPKTLAVTGTEDVEGRHGMVFEQSRSACQGFALARAESGRVLAPHTLVFTGDTSSNTSGYGGSEGREAEVFDVPIIDEDAPRVLGESVHLRGLGNAGHCALPRAATVGKAGLFVSCVGEDKIALYDADVANPHDVEIGHWNVPSGPTGLALDETRERAVVWSQFAHALTTIAIGDGSDTVKPFAISSVTVPRRVHTLARLQRGRELFHDTRDPRVSADGRACASCHPDGRDDTLVWSSPKGPRQTPMLAGRLDGAAPFGWNGDAVDVETHMTSTFKRLGGKGVLGEDKEALVAYVKSMRLPAHEAPRDVAQVQRGLAIYRSSEAQCSTCHGEGGDMPDGNKHDVKSWSPGDVQATFDTPSLRGLSGSAPYFHDGRYDDLTKLLLASDGKMGHTKHLAPTELADLRAYLETL